MLVKHVSGNGPCSGADDAWCARTCGEKVSDRILYEAGVFITPGFIFGKNGRDYVRISLCAKPEVLESAAGRIAAFLHSKKERHKT